MKIEVFIPAYNCRKTLARTLASLAAQTDSDFSVCVVDDCNAELLSDICAMFPTLKLRIVRNERNLGCGLSRQSAIDTSDADYLIPLDSDDMLLPMAIDIFRQEAAKHPDTDFFIGQCYNEFALPNGTRGIKTDEDGLTLVSGKMYKAAFLRRYGIRNCEEFSRFADDTYFNMLCFELGERRYIPLPLYFYTHNPQSVTNVNSGRDYWANITPKFLRCIELTTEMICRYKPADEIVHLDGTLTYVKGVVLRENDAKNVRLYNRLLDRLAEMGRTIERDEWIVEEGTA